MTAPRLAFVVATLLVVLPSPSEAQRSSSSRSTRNRSTQSAPAQADAAPAAATPDTNAPATGTADTTASVDDAAARDHFEAGRAYFARAQYDDASREFAEAYRLSQRLTLLLNLARALEAANRDEEAVASLDEWLAKSPSDDPMRAEVLDRRTRLANEVEARRAAAASVSTSASVEATPPPPQRSRALFYTGLGTLGLGVVAGGIAIGTGVAAHNIHQDLESRCPAGNCPPGSQSDIDRGTALSRASTAMTFIGVAAAGTGLVLVLIGRKRHDDAPAVTPVVGPRTVGAQLRLSF